MIKKNLILIGILVGVLLLVVATFFYPGGSIKIELSESYDWFNNYISDLLNPKAVNGMRNPARLWAIAGIFFLTASFGHFFIKFSNKINQRGASNVIRYFGITLTVLAFLTAIPSLHDMMVTITSIISLIIFFYITVLAFKLKSNYLKVLSPIFLLTFYIGAYMYFTRSYLEYMPIMQKIIFLVKIVWVLTLEYFTQEGDFSSNNELNPI